MFQLPLLTYTYHALEPNIDAYTMQTHYEKHFAGYLNKMNKALSTDGYPTCTIEEVIKTFAKKNTTLRNNGGGYYNHLLFFENIAPNGGGMPKGKLAEAIVRDFNRYEDFVVAFSACATKHFGSGWAWLCTDASGKLHILSTPNQDNPLMLEGVTSYQPILGLDLWEHAYYLKYQNRRGDYIKAFWNIVYWPKVEERYVGHLS
ncbi:MAG: superoxide dismutase [Cytophagales bacterium]